jgi:cobalt-zinc-cadmium efflux system outer membrane protein
LEQSPQERELRARVALTEAEARIHAVYANPSVAYSREGAGYNAFFEASQVLPVSGRVGYLRQAVGAAVSAADSSRRALLWSLRSDLRVAFFRMVAAQERIGILNGRIRDVEELTRILRRREEEGEGSRYDRLRAERELAELRTDVTAAQSLVAASGARVAGFLPEGVAVQHVKGDLTVAPATPNLDDLFRRALSARAEYRAEQGNRAYYQIEEQAARRLRFPEPLVSAGVKRADVISGTLPSPFVNVTQTGLAFSVSVPLPIFNTGRYEVARYQAEQEQADARLALLARQIHTEVEGAHAVLSVRRDALAAYQREMESSGSELIRITRTAYDEGEIGILELLDAYRLNGVAGLRRLDLEAGVKEAFIELERAVGEELAGTEVQP